MLSTHVEYLSRLSLIYGLSLSAEQRQCSCERIFVVSIPDFTTLTLIDIHCQQKFVTPQAPQDFASISADW